MSEFYSQNQCDLFGCTYKCRSFCAREPYLTHLRMFRRCSCKRGDKDFGRSFTGNERCIEHGHSLFLSLFLSHKSKIKMKLKIRRVHGKNRMNVCHLETNFFLFFFLCVSDLR